MIVPKGLLACLLVLTPALSSAEAAESIRVLLAQDAGHVEVKAADEVIVRLPGGQERSVRESLIFTTLENLIGVNGTKLSIDALTLRSRSGYLSITLGALSNGSSRATNGHAPPQASEPRSALEVSGVVHVLRRGKGLMVVNELDLEEYVKGVVPSEVSSGWHLEVLKAQAVAARTYALYQRMLSAAREYDVIAGTQDQVYRGRQGVESRVEQAVEDTRGLVVTYQNAPIYAAFSSTAAGPTEDAMNVWAKDLPYLKGVDCPFDLSSPYYQWKIVVKLDTLERNLRQQGLAVGTIASVTPFAYSRAGRVTRIRILHSRGELILRGEDLRRVVGYTVVPSTQFEIELQGQDIVIAGYGAGHAVGLCQWGAKELAEIGYSFATILQYYYPGTELLSAILTKPPLIPVS